MALNMSANPAFTSKPTMHFPKWDNRAVLEMMRVAYMADSQLPVFLTSDVYFGNSCDIHIIQCTCRVIRSGAPVDTDMCNEILRLIWHTFLTFSYHNYFG